MTKDTRITPICTLAYDLYKKTEPVIDICEKSKRLKRIVVLGWKGDGEFYYDTNLNNGEVLDLLDAAKKEIVFREYEWGWILEQVKNE